jgi:hypothetical protein
MLPHNFSPVQHLTDAHMCNSYIYLSLEVEREEKPTRDVVESAVETVSAYSTGRLGSLVVVIPVPVKDKLKVKKGSRFLVKIDSHGRIIYEPLPPLALQEITAP